jgi:hypothetical protein
VSKFVWWVAGILFVAYIFVGGGPAASLRNTAFDATGATSGLMVGGIPIFVGAFKQGMAHSPSPDSKTSGGSGASWSGGVSNWTQAPAAPARQAHPHRHHRKPNA